MLLSDCRSGRIDETLGAIIQPYRLWCSGKTFILVMAGG